MSLAIVLSEALARIATARSLLRIVEAHELSLGAGDDASKAAKGMLFVQNYAAYEFVIIGVVRTLVATLNSKSLNFPEVRAELLSMALDPDFSSIVDGSKKNPWERRANLIKRSRAAQPVSVGAELFPRDGSHFRPPQLETIWTLFGIQGPIVPDNRLIGHIIELVDTRNRIAHGSDSPEAVGSRFSTGDMKKRIDDTEAVCTHVVMVAAAYMVLPNAFK